MTDNQYKIFKAVRRYRTLPEILTATGISDYLTLQEDAGVGMLDFSDCEMDEKTIVTLTNPAAEAFESRRRSDWAEIRRLGRFYRNYRAIFKITAMVLTIAVTVTAASVRLFASSMRCLRCLFSRLFMVFISCVCSG